MTEYNGWTNYETWCVNLWLTNEEGSNEVLMSMIPKSKDDVYGASNILKDWVKETFYESNVGEGYGLLYDLLNSALDNVNWREIIENHLDD